MSKDYARNKSRKNSRKKRGSKSSSHWKLWAITILLLVLFIWGLLQLAKRPHIVSVVKNIPVTVVKSVKVQKTVPKPVVTTSQPVFDFYTILPKEKVVINNAPKGGAGYYLQIASLKDSADADRLKAELALLGFDAFIEQITDKDQTWDRVSVGPYVSEQAAKADQTRLLNNNIKSILRKKQD